MSLVLLRSLSVTPFVVLGLVVIVSGEERRPRSEQTPDPVSEVRPLLAKYCVSCHGEKPRADLDLRSPTDLVKWAKVWERVRSRQMPPPGRPQPTAKERDQFTAA